jgi:mannose/fructose-specific phosphotransferase system component IIA
MIEVTGPPGNARKLIKNRTCAEMGKARKVAANEMTDVALITISGSVRNNVTIENPVEEKTSVGTVLATGNEVLIVATDIVSASTMNAASETLARWTAAFGAMLIANSSAAIVTVIKQSSDARDMIGDTMTAAGIEWV